MELVRQFGDLPISRLRLDRFPATEADVVELHDREDRLYELVDGVLVEKTKGYREGYIAAYVARMLGNFVEPRNLGIVNGADGMMKLAPGLVRIPDVSFVSWKQLPSGEFPKGPIPLLAPEIAIEVLSESNTREEMEKKRREYFAAGGTLVWEVDPETQTVHVYRAAEYESPTVLGVGDILAGDPVLPGFSLPVADIFNLPRRT